MKYLGIKRAMWPGTGTVLALAGETPALRVCEVTREASFGNLTRV